MKLVCLFRKPGIRKSWQRVYQERHFLGKNHHSLGVSQFWVINHIFIVISILKTQCNVSFLLRNCAFDIIWTLMHGITYSSKFWYYNCTTKTTHTTHWREWRRNKTLEYYMTFVLSCSLDLTPIANYLDYHVLRHIPKDAIPFQLCWLSFFIKV